jgi:hypothetical protein
MKTAVKFLEKVFFTYAEPYAGFSEKEKWVISESDFMELIEQAKEMEKQQIINAHFAAQIEDIRFWNEAKEEANDYYNETFKSE